MTDEIEKFVIAVKREMRSAAPSDWINQLLGIDGISPLGKPSASRIMVKSTPAAIEAAKSLLGKYCHIEPLKLRKPLNL